jgi:hypothetical protein
MHFDVETALWNSSRGKGIILGQPLLLKIYSELQENSYNMYHLV